MKIYKKEIMWLQHAKRKWLKKGDTNMTFLHKTRSTRRMVNNIQKGALSKVTRQSTTISWNTLKPPSDRLLALGWARV